MAAATLYCTVADVQSLGVPPNAIAMLTTAQIQAQIGRASAEIDSFLASRYTLPFPPGSWGVELNGWCVDIVSFRLLKFRGFNPEDGVNVAMKMAYDDAFKALREVSNGTRTLQINITGGGGPQPDDSVDVHTDKPRNLENDDPDCFSEPSRFSEFWFR